MGDAGPDSIGVLRGNKRLSTHQVLNPRRPPVPSSATNSRFVTSSLASSVQCDPFSMTVATCGMAIVADAKKNRDQKPDQVALDENRKLGGPESAARCQRSVMVLDDNDHG